MWVKVPLHRAKLNEAKRRETTQRAKIVNNVIHEKRKGSVNYFFP